MADAYPAPGSTLKSLRLARKWSLSQAALATGVSKAMLGQIEREESSPTVATLWKIATGFNVPFSLFITDEPAEESPAVRSSEVSQSLQLDATMQASPLFSFDRQLGFDMLEVQLAAGAVSESSPHDRGVIEHIVVLSGELQLEIDGSWHTLISGEGLRFQADRVHSYRNPGDTPCRFYSLIHYPPAQKA